MSLFQVRSWWQHSPSNNEEYDSNHLVVGNADNNPENKEKLVTASLEGLIRIFAPETKGYNVEHLVFEENMGAPICQIALGGFVSLSGVCEDKGIFLTSECFLFVVSNDPRLYLAILHPKELCVYLITPISSVSDQLQYYELKLQYKHILERSAYNMIYGPFGKKRWVFFF
ncbi:protein PTHB1 [Reticulomyxa filosa]|uniref:Protein PTHB1 n=1 Tax=Reticulomyxa filosa TaxID=46433 RepID=X6NKM2_RETFI|nr:protein PTHB1 [Reticulomyxa filosa]|eukprot:ETO26860.1 protein PTHB1 [Reticulomyxa filosa]